jgi:hypothetical protein
VSDELEELLQARRRKENEKMEEYRIANFKFIVIKFLGFMTKYNNI